MQVEKRTTTNTAVGVGALFQGTGYLLWQLATLGAANPWAAVVGPILLVVSIPLMIWGCMSYAEGKGHSRWVGLVGLAGLIGLIVLILLPDLDRSGSAARLQSRKLVGLVATVAGFGLVVLGRWFREFGDGNVALARWWDPWSNASLVVGVCLVILGALLLTLGNGRR